MKIFKSAVLISQIQGQIFNFWLPSNSNYPDDSNRSIMDRPRVFFWLCSWYNALNPDAEDTDVDGQQETSVRPALTRAFLKILKKLFRSLAGGEIDFMAIRI